MNKIRRSDYVAADHILWDSAKYRKKTKKYVFHLSIYQTFEE